MYRNGNSSSITNSFFSKVGYGLINLIWILQFLKDFAYKLCRIVFKEEVSYLINSIFIVYNKILLCDALYNTNVYVSYTKHICLCDNCINLILLV